MIHAFRKVLVGKSKGKRPLTRHRPRWENNNRMGLREIECDCVDCINFAQDRDQLWVRVSMAMTLLVPNGL
jgi:hypothetical protein